MEQEKTYIREKAGSLPLILETLQEILTVLKQINKKLDIIKEGI